MFTEVKKAPPKHLAMGNRKKSFTYHCADHLTINTSSMNWSGGSISAYDLVNLATGTREPITGATWPDFEVKTVKIPTGYAIVESGTFCGKTKRLRFTLNESDVSKLTGDQ